MIVAHVAVLPDQALGQLLGYPRARGPKIVRILQDVASMWDVQFNLEIILPLVILVVDAGQRPLLRVPLHLVSPPQHQHIHNIQRVVIDPLEDKSANTNK